MNSPNAHYDVLLSVFITYHSLVITKDLHLARLLMQFISQISCYISKSCTSQYEPSLGVDLVNGALTNRWH